MKKDNNKLVCLQCSHAETTNLNTQKNKKMVFCKFFCKQYTFEKAASCPKFCLNVFSSKRCIMCSFYDLSGCQCEKGYNQDSSTPYGKLIETENNWASKCKHFFYNKVFPLNTNSKYDNYVAEAVNKLPSMASDSDAIYFGNEVFRVRLAEKNLLRFHISRLVKIREREEYIAIDISADFLIEILNKIFVAK